MPKKVKECLLQLPSFLVEVAEGEDKIKISLLAYLYHFEINIATITLMTLRYSATAERAF